VAKVIWLRKRHDKEEQPEKLTAGVRAALSLMALFVLAIITLFTTLVTQAAWWVVAMHVAVATCGASFLLVLFLMHFAHPNEARHKQFSIRLALVGMVGLGLMLAGIGGIFRLARFDPSQTTPVDWAILVGVFAVIFLFGTPLLAVLLETIVTLVNATLRLPVVRRLFRAARRAKESDQP
jgi:hypothetical protein